MASLDDEFIHSLIGEEPSWLYRKEWDSYPRLTPISSFAPVEPMKGFHYLGAMEPWVSTYVSFFPMQLVADQKDGDSDYIR